MELISSVPITKAEQYAPDSIRVSQEVYFTFSAKVDERALFRKVNSQLGRLEGSLEIDWPQLEKVREAAAGFLLDIEAREETQRRVDWLERLYRVKEQSESIRSPKQARQLLAMLASVQQCPLKKVISEKLLVFEQVEQKSLMERALKEAGEEFINLGKIGRQFVITRMGKDDNIEQVRKFSQELEHSVEALKELKSAEKMIKALHHLPLKSFPELPVAQKAAIAESLINSGNWNGLADLDRRIAKIVRVPGTHTIPAQLLEA